MNLTEKNLSSSDSQANEQNNCDAHIRTEQIINDCEKEKPTGWAGLAFGSIITYFAVMFTTSLLLAIPLSMSMDISQGAGAANFLYAVQILAGIITIVIVYLIMKAGGDFKLRFHSESKTIKSNIGQILIIFVAFLFAQATVGVLISSIINAEEAAANQIRAIAGGNAFLSVFSVCIIAPICEEVVCRGGVYGGLKKKIKTIPAAIISSIVFGLIHFNGWISLVMFFMGLILCALYEATDNLLFPISFHMLNNVVALLSGYYGISLLLPNNYIFICAILFVSVVAVIFSCKKILESSASKKETDE